MIFIKTQILDTELNVLNTIFTDLRGLKQLRDYHSKKDIFILREFNSGLFLFLKPNIYNTTKKEIEISSNPIELIKPTDLIQQSFLNANFHALQN